jgi:hypothetical protein
MAEQQQRAAPQQAGAAMPMINSAWPVLAPPMTRFRVNAQRGDE